MHYLKEGRKTEVSRCSNAATVLQIKALQERLNYVMILCQSAFAFNITLWQLQTVLTVRNSNIVPTILDWRQFALDFDTQNWLYIEKLGIMECCCFSYLFSNQSMKRNPWCNMVVVINVWKTWLHWRWREI